MEFKFILSYFNIFLYFVKGFQSYRTVSLNYSGLIPHFKVKQMFINNTSNTCVNRNNINNDHCRFNTNLFDSTHSTGKANNFTSKCTGCVDGFYRNSSGDNKHNCKLYNFNTNTSTYDNEGYYDKGSNEYDLLFSVNSPDDLKSLPIELLPRLCRQIRTYLGETISKTGGHFSGSLGVNELTVALHYVFNSPKDKIVWDIGHQAYVHKILTGRRYRLETMRKRGGLSGYCRMDESKHDVFGAGHSSTSISFSQGLLEGQMLLNGDTPTNNKVISIIGDGGMTAGLAYESLNYAINLKTPLIIVYNDNHQVSLPTGLSSVLGNRPVVPFFLQKTSNKPTRTLNVALEEFNSSLTNGANTDYLNIIGPIDGHNIYELTHLFNLIKNQEEYKWKVDNETIRGVNGIGSCRDRCLYVGNVKVTGPLIIHIKTIKGLGCAEAIQSLDTLHAIKPNTRLTMVDTVLNHGPNASNLSSSKNDTLCGLNSDGFASDDRMLGARSVPDNMSSDERSMNGTNGDNQNNRSGIIDSTRSLEYYKSYVKYVDNKAVVKEEVFDCETYSHVFASTLIKLAEVDPTVVAVTAAMPGGTGVGLFGSFFPERTFDVGICEQHAVTFSAGLASSGLKPYVSIYSTFLQRGLDQLIHDVLIQDINIKLLIDRAGYVGEDGLSHQGNYDVNILRMFKNLVFMFPSDQLELALMLKLSAGLNKPVAIRYTKDKVPSRSQLDYQEDFYNYVKYYKFLDRVDSYNKPGTPDTNADTFNISNTTTTTNISTTNSDDSYNGSNCVITSSTLNEFDKYYNDLSNFKSKVVRQGKGVAILCLGSVLQDVIKSLEYLDSAFDPTLIDMRFLNPLDLSILDKLKGSHTHLITVEEVISGGLGTAVLEHLTETDQLSQFKVKCINYPYEFMHHATMKEQREMAQIDPKGISNQIRDFLRF